MTGLQDLKSHLAEFVSGRDRSIAWAKEAESLLDELGDILPKGVLDELQSSLSLYCPGGKGHLFGELELNRILESALNASVLDGEGQ